VSYSYPAIDLSGWYFIFFVGFLIFILYFLFSYLLALMGGVYDDLTKVRDFHRKFRC